MINGLLGQATGELLTLFYTRADELFYTRELVRALGMGTGAVQQGIGSLLDKRLIMRVSRNGRYFYRANIESPIFPELRSLVSKDSLIEAPKVLRSALAPLKSKIRAAFIFGSVAKGNARPDSDVDVMIVGDVDFSDVTPLIARAESRVHREVNPVVYTPREFQAAKQNHFVNAVMNDEKLFILGAEDDLRRFGDKVRARKAA